jgi:LEA14-like dessication related protein
MPVILVIGALYFILNLLKQENISLEPVNLALDLKSGVPRLKVKVKIYNPSKLPLRITQVQALAASNAIQLGTFNLNQVITIPAEATIDTYFDFRISVDALTNLKKLYLSGQPINVAGYAIANGVKINFNKNVAYS